MLRRASLRLVAALALVIAACVSTPVVLPPMFLSAVDQPFGIEGRLSARSGREAVALAFVWTHAVARDEFVLTTPLGQALAELTSDALSRRVEVRTADGRRDEAGDWAVLTERAVGFPLPVGGLAWWARGVPHANSPHWMELDSAGRAGVLRQDGCEIVYSYADAFARLPTRLGLACRDVEMRIVIDRWHVA